MSLIYDDLRHECDLPATNHLPIYGTAHQVIARWRCPVCHQRWKREGSFLHSGRFYWGRIGGPSRRWRRAEAARLSSMETQ